MENANDRMTLLYRYVGIFLGDIVPEILSVKICLSSKLRFLMHQAVRLSLGRLCSCAHIRKVTLYSHYLWLI